MEIGIIGSFWVAYDVAAAVNDAVDPASLMPSCRIWPISLSLYASISSASTAV